MQVLESVPEDASCDGAGAGSWAGAGAGAAAASGAAQAWAGWADGCEGC